MGAAIQEGSKWSVRSGKLGSSVGENGFLAESAEPNGEKNWPNSEGTCQTPTCMLFPLQQANTSRNVNRRICSEEAVAP